MSTSISAQPTGDVLAGSGRPSLRRLYFVRFGFAVVWAAVFAVAAAKAGSSVNLPVGALLVLYPLFDAAAAVVDLRSEGADRRAPLIVNLVLSSATAVGLAVATASGTPAVLRVWAGWAITAGIVQVVVAIGRRRMGGHLPMILSGTISVLAGSNFAVQAGGTEPALTTLAGYATLGGIFFLVAALRLPNTARDAG